MSYDTSVFVLVEGKVFDPYFAEKICEGSSKISRLGYEIRLVSQIKTDSGASPGGKASSIDLFDYCKKVGKLRQRNAGGERVVAFLIDRDAQHLTGGMRRSPHLIYTVYADAEAHIFYDSDEVGALSLAASLDGESAADLHQALGDWPRQIADIWRLWIELCYIADATRSWSWVGLGHPKSLIHVGKYSTTLDADKLSAARTAVRNGSPMNDALFSSRESLVMSRIDAIFRRNQQASLLKGKWLPGQLTHYVDDYFRNSRGDDYEWHEKGFKESVARCYAAKLRIDAPGIRKIRVKLEALL